MFTLSVFRRLAIQNAQPAPTLARIEAIEDLLGAKLPESFLELLRVGNGGYLEYVIDVPVGGGRTEPLSFCGLFSADDGSFCDETFVGQIRSGREYAQIPTGVLPFARDGGGSVVYLDLSPEGRGRVVAFVHGLPPWAGVRTESAYVELAGSFDEYVDKLRPDREAVLDHLEHDTEEVSHVEAWEAFLDVAIPEWRDDGELRDAVAASRRRLGG